MIRDEFRVHKLNEEGLRRASELAKAFSELLSLVEMYVHPAGRDIALVRTKLQEACFFAKRGMASLLNNQVTE